MLTKPILIFFLGIYPVIGWKDRGETIFMAEGSSNDNGTILEWGKTMG